MAKRGTLENPKTKRLARALKTCPGVALGMLETLWHWVGEFRRDGALTKIDVEDALDSGGWLTLYTADQVVAAMTDAARECVFLDALPDGRYYVHDWHEHADDSVNRWLARRVETFANGLVPDLKRLGKEERERIEGEYQKTEGARKAHDGAPSAHVGRTASALPEPEPEPEPGPREARGAHEAETVDVPAPAAPLSGPVPLPDWRRRIDGRWCILGTYLDEPEVVEALEAFDVHRLSLLKGGLSDGVIHAFATIVTEKKPTVAQLVGFLRQAVLDGLETPNARAFLRWMGGTYRPTKSASNGAGGAGPQGTCNPVNNPVTSDAEIERLSEVARR